MLKNFCIIRIVVILIVLTLTSCISCHDDREKMEIQYCRYEVKIKSSLNVREHPSSESRKIGTLYDKDTVLVESINDDWAKIRYASQYAYVASRYLVSIDNVDGERVADKNANNNTEFLPTTVDEESIDVGNGTNLLLFDNAGILSSEDCMMINEAYANTNVFLIIWTTDSIDKGDILGYNEHVFDLLEDEPYKDKIATNTSLDLDDESVYVITFVKELGLLQVKNESDVMSLIEVSMPEKYLKMQLNARQNGLKAGMMDLLTLINEATQKYNEGNWVVRKFGAGSSLGEMLTATIFKDQILPSNSFWYKYIFSWMTKIPRNFLNYLIAIFGSLLNVVILLCFIYIITTLIFIRSSGYKKGKSKTGVILLWAIICSFILTCLILLLLYTMCDMADIMAMEMYGWSNEMITVLLDHNLNYQVLRHWWLSVLFFIGMFIYKLPDPWILVASMLPSKIQKKLAENNESHFMGNTNLMTKESPYTDLFGDKLGQSIGGSIFIMIALTLLLNGTSMMYVTIFAWALVIGKVYSAVQLYLIWKSYGYFRY